MLGLDAAHWLAAVLRVRRLEHLGLVDGEERARLRRDALHVAACSCRRVVLVRRLRLRRGRGLLWRLPPRLSSRDMVVVWRAIVVFQRLPPRRQ